MTPRDEWRLDTLRIGRRVLVFERLDSTNTLAASLTYEPANDGLAILADEQTAGRGRLGRHWHCPPAAGVLLSVLLFPPAALERATILTAWAAVAVCETIRRLTQLPARIKWPNDVLIHGRKVCGILLERRSTATICGIGLNLVQTAEHFVAAELPDAASLGMFTPPPQRDETARTLLQQLDTAYDRLRAGDLDTLLGVYSERLGLLGKQVAVASSAAILHGRLCSLTWDGLGLETDEGRLLHLRPEMVQQITKVQIDK